MDEANTPTEEAPEVKEETKVTKTAKKTKPKTTKAKAPKKEVTKKEAKKPISKATKKAAPKTTKERKALAKKAEAPKKPKKEKTESKRYTTVNGEKWHKKKVAILSILQKSPKKEFTKQEIGDELDKLNMTDLNTNKFCWEMEKEGYVEMISIEGDPNWYRQATAKGAKLKLPVL